MQAQDGTVKKGSAPALRVQSPLTKRNGDAPVLGVNGGIVKVVQGGHGCSGALAVVPACSYTQQQLRYKPKQSSSA